MSINIKHSLETLAAIREAVKDLDRKQISDVFATLMTLLDHMNFMQKLPMVVRLQYWKVAFALVEYLQRNQQLCRHEGRIDGDVIDEFVLIIDKIMREYGCYED